LKWTEAAAQQNQRLLPTVYNGMACCLRKEGKHRSALSLLQQAAGLAKTTGQSPAVCGNTYLNMCAVLSSVGKHPEALDAAKQALRYLRKGLTDLETPAEIPPVAGAEVGDQPPPPKQYTPVQRQARADLAVMPSPLAMRLL
jgi:tetratricopeptide (TPR) repeat protein